MRACIYLGATTRAVAAIFGAKPNCSNSAKKTSLVCLLDCFSCLGCGLGRAPCRFREAEQTKSRFVAGLIGRTLNLSLSDRRKKYAAICRRQGILKSWGILSIQLGGSGMMLANIDRRFGLSLFLGSILATGLFGADVDWVPNSNGDWDEVANWSSNPLLPTASDDVTIDVGGVTLRSIRHDVGTTTIGSLQLSERLNVVGGSVTVQGAVTLAADSTLIANGGSVLFNGSVQADGADLEAAGGSVLTIPITSFDQTGGSVRFRASQAGSVLDLSTLTSIAGSTTNFRDVTMEALSGSLLDLGSLSSITRPSNFSNVRISADGAGSEVDLSSHADFTSGAVTDVTTLNGGTISWSNPTAIQGVNVTVGGLLATQQIVSLTNGSLHATDGVVPNTNNLTNADGSSLIAGDLFSTGTLSFPLLTSYTNTATSDIRFTSEGSSSFLDLSALESIAGNQSDFRGFVIEAKGGGSLDLSQLTSATRPANFGSFVLASNGVGSLFDVASFADYSSGAVTDVNVTNGGAMVWSNPTAIDRVSLVLDGVLATGQIADFTNGRILVTNSDSSPADFGNLTNVDGSSLVAGTLFDSGILNLPQVTTYTNTSGAAEQLRAERVGSLLDLSNLQTIDGGPNMFAALNVRAFDGGTVDLSSVTSILKPSQFSPITLESSGAGSVVDLSAYAAYTSEQVDTIVIGEGATFLWSNPTTIRGLDLEIGGTIDTTQLASFQDGSLQVDEEQVRSIGSLTDVDGSSLIAGELFSSGTLTLPSVTNYMHTGTAARVLRSTRAGSELNFPNLNTVTGNSDLFIRLTVDAANSGTINFSAGTTLFQTDVEISATAGGLITGGTLHLANGAVLRGDAGIMANVLATDGGLVAPGVFRVGALSVTGDIRAANGGVIDIGTEATLVASSGVFIESAGILTGDGTIDGMLTVNGVVQVDDIEETLDVTQIVALGAGSTIRVSEAYVQDAATISAEFTLLQSAASLTGMFDTPADSGIPSHLGDGMFLDSISYLPNAVDMSVYSAIPGDANGDKVVDGADFVIWNQNKFQSGTDWTTGDFNGDGETNGGDFVIWNSFKFTELDMNLNAVPEPGGDLLLVVMISCWAWRRR